MKMSEAEFERQYLEATKRGAVKRRTHPWAMAVKYDRKSSMLVVKLNKGIILSVPTAIVPELNGLKPDDLAKVAVLGPGYDLDWEHLDIQVSVAWLLTGMYGTSAVMSAIGRKGGAAKSNAKAKASRANGAKGGRPRLARKRAVAAAK